MHFLPRLDLQPFCAPAFLRAHRVGRRMKNRTPSNGWKSSLFLTQCQTAPLIKFLSRLTLKRTTEDEIKTTFIARLYVSLWETGFRSDLKYWREKWNWKNQQDPSKTLVRGTTARYKASVFVQTGYYQIVQLLARQDKSQTERAQTTPPVLNFGFCSMKQLLLSG